MNAKEARRLAEEFNPDLDKILEIIKNEALNGGFSTSGASEFLFDIRVRQRLETMGYTIKWYDIQRAGYWEISW